MRLGARTRPPWGGRSAVRHRDAGAVPTPWRDVLRRRVLVAACAFAVWVVSIEAKLIHLQVVQHAALVERAGNQQRRTIEVHSKRGEILDRNGRVLAYSVDADTVYAVPSEIDDPAATARALCSALDDCGATGSDALERRLGRRRAYAVLKADPSSEEMRRVAALGLEGVGVDSDAGTVYAAPTRIHDADLAATASAICSALDDCDETRRGDLEARLGRRSAFVYVRRKASPEEARRVAALGLDGVGFLTEDRRYYPNRELAAHLIGYVGIDNQGLSGIESIRSGSPATGTDLTDGGGTVRSSRFDPALDAAGPSSDLDSSAVHRQRECAGVRAYEPTRGGRRCSTGDRARSRRSPHRASFNPTLPAATPSERRNRAVQECTTGVDSRCDRAAAFDDVYVHRDGVRRQRRYTGSAATASGPSTPTAADLHGRCSQSSTSPISGRIRLGPERLAATSTRLGSTLPVEDFPSEAPVSSGAPYPSTMGHRSLRWGTGAVTPLQMATAIPP